MPITPCPACGFEVRAPDSLRGCRVQCPSCYTRFVADELLEVLPARPARSSLLEVLPAEPVGVPPWVWWTVGGLVGALTPVTCFALLLPRLMLPLGFGVVAMSLVYFLAPPVRGYLDTLIGSEPRHNIRKWVCAGGVLALGLVVVILSSIGWQIDRRKQLANETVARKVEDARVSFESGRFEEAEGLLREALAVDDATETFEAQALLDEVEEARTQVKAEQERRAAAGRLQEAETALEGKRFAKAVELLQQYLALPHGTEHARVKRLLEQAEVVVSKKKALALLGQMSAEQFSEWSETGELPPELQSGHPALAEAYQAALLSNREEEAGRRKAEQVALAESINRALKAHMERTERAKQAEQARREAILKSAIKVEARVLVAEYQANEIAADQRYKGKLLLVTGTVESVGRDILEQRYVALKSGKRFDIFCVQCYFSAEYEDSLATVKPGRGYTILGKCDGKFLNVVLKNCSFPE